MLPVLHKTAAFRACSSCNGPFPKPLMKPLTKLHKIALAQPVVNLLTKLLTKSITKPMAKHRTYPLQTQATLQAVFKAFLKILRPSINVLITHPLSPQ